MNWLLIAAFLGCWSGIGLLTALLFTRHCSFVPRERKARAA